MEKIIKKLYKYIRRNKVRYKIFFMAIVAFLLFVFCWWCDSLYISGNSACFFKLLFIVRPVQKDNIVASFNILWSVFITITIFILEISERYKYGVPLKRIVYLLLGQEGIFVGAFGFLMLYPLFYICMKLNRMLTGVFCLAVLFIAFVMVITFFAWIYKGKNIRKLLQEKTWEQIINFADQEKLHEKIDGLAISTMLDHIDYSNVEEVSGLIEIFRNMFQKSEFWNELYQGKVENLIITTWLDHMIHSCFWDTDYECTQNFNTIRILWKEIMETISNDDSQKNEKEMAVCIQFLRPFINENNEKNNDMMVRIWREFGIYRKQTVVYMLLYTTYKLYRSNIIQYTWVLHNELELRDCLQDILSGNFWWDEFFAIKCWIDWSRYECRNDINFVPLYQFINDMNRLRERNWYNIKTPILIQITGGMV